MQCISILPCTQRVFRVRQHPVGPFEFRRDLRGIFAFEHCRLRYLKGVQCAKEATAHFAVVDIMEVCLAEGQRGRRSRTEEHLRARVVQRQHTNK